jgi:hypothetical protein
VSRSRSSWLAIALATTVAFAGVRGAAADEPGTETPEHLAEAKGLFQQGNVLRRAGDDRGALEYYLRSRAIVPSMPNTFNAAICLERLGRIDEALELYEELLTKYRGELNDAEQAQLKDSITTLRRQLGSIEVIGDVGGTLLVDGRVRGTLPIVAPVRVRPGSHTVRVFKEGWEPYESTLTVERAAFVTLDVRLRPLAEAGRLRVESDNLAGGELFLDGAPLGRVPWEGSLAPGPHLYSVKSDTLGTAPARANVVQGQRVVLTAHGVPIGPEVHVSADPSSAEIWIDTVPLGRGPWRGSLPVGPHTFEAREPGYVTASERRETTSAASSDVALALRVDPDHPRWAKPRRAVGTPSLGVFGGPALGLSFGGGTAPACGAGRCARDTAFTGAIAGLRGAYAFPSGLYVDTKAGYMAVSRGASRSLDDSFVERDGTSVAVTYQIDDAIHLTGVFYSAGVGYARPLAPWLELSGGLEVGALVLRTRDDSGGTASGGGRTLDLSIANSGIPAYGVAPYAAPEARLALKLGRFDVALGLAVAIFPLEGPTFPNGELRVYGGACHDHLGAVDCLPGRNVDAGRRAYGQMLFLWPTLGAGARF